MVRELKFKFSVDILQMEETNPIPAAPYNRGRGSDFIWEHYTFYKAKEENKKTLDEVRCIYCEGIMVRIRVFPHDFD